MERNVPKLRFKGFNDEWKKEVISSICKLSSGSTPSKVRKEYFNGTHLWVTSGELKNKYIYNTIDKITDKAIKDTNLKEYEMGSFIIAIYGLEAQGTRGSSAILGRKATISQACMAIEPVKDIYSEFLYYWYAKYGDMIGIRYAQGTKQQNLSTDLVGNLKIIFPSLKEQERITNFLTKVDKIIEKQEEKVKNLENYKKGMMQKIFSQEIRFKDENGEEYPEWNKEHLGNLVERVVRKNKGNISNRPLTISAKYGLVDQEEFFNKVVASSNLEGYYLLENGEFAYNKSYSNGYPFGAIKRLDKYDDGAVSTLYICFKPKNGLSSDFLCHYFESDMWHKEVAMVAVEGARNHGLLNISVGDFFDTIHKVPCKKEQIQIANFLNNISNLLYKEENKFKELQKWKKALLQQMFV